MVSVRTATAEEEQTTHRSRTRRGAGVGAGSSTSVGAGSNRRSRVHLLWRIYGDASSKSSRAKRPRGFGTVAWRRSGMTFDVIRCVFSILSFFKSRRAVCTRQVLSVCTQHWVSMNSLQLGTTYPDRKRHLSGHPRSGSPASYETSCWSALHAM
jgi:hypothetical protein